MIVQQRTLVKESCAHSSREIFYKPYHVVLSTKFKHMHSICTSSTYRSARLRCPARASVPVGPPDAAANMLRLASFYQDSQAFNVSVNLGIYTLLSGVERCECYEHTVIDNPMMIDESHLSTPLWLACSTVMFQAKGVSGYCIK